MKNRGEKTQRDTANETRENRRASGIEFNLTAELPLIIRQKWGVLRQDGAGKEQP